MAFTYGEAQAGFFGRLIGDGRLAGGAVPWSGGLSRHLHQAMVVAGGISLGAALLVHFAVGYTTPLHLMPPLMAGGSLVVGLALQWPGCRPIGRA